uniref:DUF222 domain-containing protein n=1 Tax=Amycolatopsis jejuensis TaxID=330084 RepID=UPI00052637B5
MTSPITLPDWQLSARELTELILTAHREQNIWYARQLGAIRELEDRGIAPAEHPTMAAFLTTALHITPREARTRVAQAKGDLPLARKALAAGNLTAQHVAVIAECLAAAPDWLTPEDYTVAEDTLVTLATQADATVVHRAATRLHTYWNHESTPPTDHAEASARPWREFRYHWTRGGRFHFTGNLDPDTGTLLEQLLVPLAAPDPADPSGT